jgi:hypothetical protein
VSNAGDTYTIKLPNGRLTVTQLPQRQDSLYHQLRDLQRIAILLGMFDADDHLKAVCEKAVERG